MTRPLLSICCITFQHAASIGQTLEGMLAQNVAFDMEILVHDDASKDGTADIIRAYMAKDRRIKSILRETNLWSTGVAITPILLAQAKGKYISLCEGDDYWTDPLKLQKQVDFLEANPDHAICFHRVQMLRGETLEEDTITEQRWDRIPNRPVTVLDLLEQGNFIHTPSVVFRRTFQELPMEFKGITIGDYLLHIINAQHGHIHRMDDVMAVYRVGSGTFSSLNEREMARRVVLAQGHILAFLQDPEQRRLALKRYHDMLGSLVMKVAAAELEEESLSHTITYGKWWRVLKRKIGHTLRNKSGRPARRPGK